MITKVTNEIFIECLTKLNCSYPNWKLEAGLPDWSSEKIDKQNPNLFRLQNLISQISGDWVYPDNLADVDKFVINSKQKVIGDCWLLAGYLAIYHTNPKVLQEMILFSPRKCNYCIRKISEEENIVYYYVLPSVICNSYLLPKIKFATNAVATGKSIELNPLLGLLEVAGAAHLTYMNRNTPLESGNRETGYMGLDGGHSYNVFNWVTGEKSLRMGIIPTMPEENLKSKLEGYSLKLEDINNIKWFTNLCLYIVSRNLSSNTIDFVTDITNTYRQEMVQITQKQLLPAKCTVVSVQDSIEEFLNNEMSEDIIKRFFMSNSINIKHLETLSKGINSGNYDVLCNYFMWLIGNLNYANRQTKAYVDNNLDLYYSDQIWKPNSPNFYTSSLKNAIDRYFIKSYNGKKPQNGVAKALLHLIAEDCRAICFAFRKYIGKHHSGLSLTDEHAYAVKKVRNDALHCINPHDSAIDLDLSWDIVRDYFLDIDVSYPLDDINFLRYSSNSKRVVCKDRSYSIDNVVLPDNRLLAYIDNEGKYLGTRSGRMFDKYIYNPLYRR